MNTLRPFFRIRIGPRALRWHCARGWLFVVGLALGAADRGPAAAEANPDPPAAEAGRTALPPALGDDELLIREVFQSHLPTTMKRNAVRLWVHPHFGDLVHRDHFRLSTGVRYGFTEHWEISASSDLYFSHGLGDVRFFDRYGAANFQVGTKINLGHPLLPGWNTAAGVDYLFPTGRPPAELTDGLRHFVPYITFSRRFESHRDRRIFWGLRLDQVTRTSTPGEAGKNDLRDDSTGVTAGFVVDRNNWHYTLETSFDTTRLIGHSAADVFTIRPGVIWEILSRRNVRVRSNWVAGAAVRGSFGPGGTNLGAALKLRYNIDLKSWFHRTPFDSSP